MQTQSEFTIASLYQLLSDIPRLPALRPGPAQPLPWTLYAHHQIWANNSHGTNWISWLTFEVAASAAAAAAADDDVAAVGVAATTEAAAAASLAAIAVTIAAAAAAVPLYCCWVSRDIYRYTL